MFRRLGVKLSLSLTVIVVLIAAVSGFISWRSQQRQLLRAMVLGADQLSKSITSATWHAMLDDHRSAAYEIMRTIAAKQGIDRIRMFNREGNLTFSTHDGERWTLEAARTGFCASCHRWGAPPRVHTVDDRVQIAASHTGYRTLNMITPIYNEPSCSQAACHAHPATIKVLGVLDLALRLDVVDQEEAHMKMQVVVATILQILLTATLIVLLTRRFVGLPIRELIRGTKAVSAMQLDKPIAIPHPSQELEELESSFNTMRERLRSALDEINQFTERLETKVAERTEQLNAAHQKLLHSDRLASLGQLAASVAHEINNPLSGVLNLSMLMERIMKDGGIPPGREEEFRRYLSRVSTETARVGRIVSDLLAFSRRSKPQRIDADLNKLVSSTISLVGHKLKLSDCQADIDLAHDLPPVWCDPSQMQQVILNLVMNAAEAMHSKGGGTVRVTTRVAASGRDVEIVVADNGEGIAPENLGKIFHPFFTTKPEGKGVGLGLAVLYGIIQAHDGEIDVKSTPGQGTTFTVTIPASRREEHAVAGADGAARAGQAR
jgi:two-component system NtrC family sensor kinase